MWRCGFDLNSLFSFLFLEVEHYGGHYADPVEFSAPQVINKILKKQLPGTEVQLGEVQANWSEKEQKLKIHLVVDAEMTKSQLMDILKKADVI